MLAVANTSAPRPDGQLNSSQSHPSGGGVDEHPRPGASCATRSSPYMAVRKATGECRRLLNAQPGGSGPEEGGGGGDVGAQASGGEAEDDVAGVEVRDPPPAHLLDDTGALGTERRSVARYMPSASSTSRKFRPAASTRSRTSPGPGALGVACSHASPSRVPALTTESRAWVGSASEPTVGRPGSYRRRLGV